MHGEINPRHVGKVDQDLAAARSNLAIHVADFRTRLDDGEAPEVVFLHFAQTMLRETNAFHLAIMFAASVLTLTERKAKEDTTTGFYFVGTSFRAVSVVHRPCNQTAGVIHNRDEPDLDQFRQVAAEHLRSCEA